MSLTFCPSYTNWKKHLNLDKTSEKECRNFTRHHLITQSNMQMYFERNFGARGNFRSSFLKTNFRACLHAGGVPQIDEVTRLGGVICLSI